MNCSATTEEILRNGVSTDPKIIIMLCRCFPLADTGSAFNQMFKNKSKSNVMAARYVSATIF
jgi:hypothetical protein